MADVAGWFATPDTVYTATAEPPAVEGTLAPAEVTFSATAHPPEIDGHFPVGAVHYSASTECPASSSLRYRMRAWNLTTVDWEVWTSIATPMLFPPSGDTVTNVTLVGVWEE